jgi:hypothetical protein
VIQGSRFVDEDGPAQTGILDIRARECTRLERDDEDPDIEIGERETCRSAACSVFASERGHVIPPSFQTAHATRETFRCMMSPGAQHTIMRRLVPRLALASLFVNRRNRIVDSRV